MTELSGTFDGVGLPAIVRFLSGLNKTGCLRIVHHDWQGEIQFDAGKVIGASLGSRQGLSALDGLVQVLRGGAFTFDDAARLAVESNISLNAEALQAHLDDLAVQMATGTARLPSFDLVPAVLAQDNSSSGEEPLPLDRGTLQTLLVVDGRRPVSEIVAQRGSLDVLWHLASLAEIGLVQFNSNQAVGPIGAQSTIATSNGTDTPTEAGPLPLTWNEPAAPEDVPAAAEAQHVVPRSARPNSVTPESVAADTSVHCPKLGFEDDSSNSFGRPTRLHRCFAAGTPLPLSLDQQRELCLTDQFATCPRLTVAGRVSPARETQPDRFISPAVNTQSDGFVLPARDTQANGSARTARATPPASGAPLGRRPGIRLPDPEMVNAPIARLPFPARAKAIERGAVIDRPPAGGAEPARFRSADAPAHDRPSTSPTSLMRARFKGASAHSAVAESPARPGPVPGTSEPRSLGQALVNIPGNRRVGGIPVMLVAGGALLLLVLAVIAYALMPHLFAGDTVDVAALPNASTAAAGVPSAQVNPTLVAASIDAATAAGTTGAASAASASAAAPVATLPPEPAAVAQAPARLGVVQPAAGTLLLDERFANNDRNWPSNEQGTAFVTNVSYRLTPLQAGQFVAIGAPIADALKDVVVSATFHKLNGPLGGGYGIIVRDQAAVPQNGTSQDGHYYVLEVGDKGEVGMWRRDGSQWVDLLPWQPNAAVKPDTASNNLSVRAVGNTLTMIVNGIPVATKTDDTFSSGRVGLFVGGDGNQVAVDRFSIQTP